MDVLPDTSRWPTYRPRRSVTAKRLSAPEVIDGRLYQDGYVVRGVDGRVVVMHVAEFEAIYELARAYE